MKMQIKEFPDFAGVSVRTLHYYDEIGLLKPAFVDKATGYRYYDETSVLCMQEILFYRELDFSLKNIKEILSSPNYDHTAALKKQQTLLRLKKERLERLIVAIDGAVKGENIMPAFDNSEFERIKTETKAKWGHTDAYRQYEERVKGFSEEDWNNSADGIDRIMEAFARCMKNGNAPGSAEAQTLAERLQTYISEHFYNCTTQILQGLGQIYVSDDRFKQNIDRYGAGTAEYINHAIAAYCNR